MARTESGRYKNVFLDLAGATFVPVSLGIVLAGTFGVAVMSADNKALGEAVRHFGSHPDAPRALRLLSAIPGNGVTRGYLTKACVRARVRVAINGLTDTPENRQFVREWTQRGLAKICISPR